MNDKELCLILGIGFMINSMLIAWSVRYNWDNQYYGDFIISLTILIASVVMIRVFLKHAFTKDKEIVSK